MTQSPKSTAQNTIPNAGPNAGPEDISRHCFEAHELAGVAVEAAGAQEDTRRGALEPESASRARKAPRERANAEARSPEESHALDADIAP